MASGLKKIIGIVVLTAAAIVGGAYYLHSQGYEHTDDAAIESHILYLSTKVSGHVSEVGFSDNQHVRKGDILLRIDARDYEIAVAQAEAGVSALKSRVVASRETYQTSRITAPSTIDAAKAAVAKAQADYDRTLSDYNRKKKLGDLVLSKQGLVDARTAMESALSSLNDAKAHLVSAETAPSAIVTAEAGTQQSQAELEQAEATLAQAKLNLEHAVIRAPFDGHIAKRSIEPGAFVQPGQQIITLVSDTYWVVANFKETQIQHMKPGQPVRIEIDAFPNQAYKGHIDSFQKGTGARFSAFPPENATGNFVKVVQRVPVKIVFDEQPDPALPIGPGMSVIPTVDIR